MRTVDRAPAPTRASSRQSDDVQRSHDAVIELLELPVRLLACSASGDLYGPGDIVVHYDHRPWGLPLQDADWFASHTPQQIVDASTGISIGVAAVAQRTIAERNATANRARPGSFFNARVARLERAREVMRAPDGRPRRSLEIWLRPTTYFTFWATHRSVVLSRPANSDVDQLPDPTLANNFPVSLFLRTRDDKLLYVRRSANVAQNPGGYGAPASGDIDPDRDARDGRPSPYAAAIREAAEELYGEIASVLKRWLRSCA